MILPLIEKIKNILKQVDDGIAQDIENQCDNDTKEAPAFDKDTLLKHIGSINSENYNLKKERDCQKVVCGLFRQSRFFYMRL